MFYVIYYFLSPKLLFYSVFQAGLKPICEFMTFNFSMQAIDQVSDNNTNISFQDVNVYQEKLEQLRK